MDSIYLSTYNLLSLLCLTPANMNLAVYGNGCCNDVMNNVDCVIKRDVYPQELHSCSKEIYTYHRCYRMVIPLVER